MKLTLLIPFAFLLSFTEVRIPTTQNDPIEIQEEADRKASFPGGTEKMNLWIKENLRMPINNVRYGIVRVEFTVKKNGKLANFVIKKGINEDMDFAAIECLQGMPIWEPAIVSGKKVNQTITLPVKFAPEQLEEKE